MFQANLPSSSNFQTTETWESYHRLLRYIPTNSILVETDNSNILLLIENKLGGAGASLLDKLASIIKHINKGKVFGRKMKMSKDDAQHIANILKEQADKLEAMSMTYRLMATALLVSKDNFPEIVSTDEHLKKVFENPFV